MGQSLQHLRPAESSTAIQNALLALVLIAPAPSVGTAMAMIIAPGPIGTAIFIFCKLWLLALPLFWLLRVDKDFLSLSKPRHGGFDIAITTGVIIAVVIWLTYAIFGNLLIDAQHVRAIAEKNSLNTPTMYLAAAVYWITLNSILEEYVYRWFIFRKCEVLLGGSAAVVASALIFTIHHTIALWVQFGLAVTILGSIGVFLGGALWSWLYLKYRSVWPCWVSHAIVDIAVFVVGWEIIFG